MYVWWHKREGKGIRNDASTFCFVFGDFGARAPEVQFSAVRIPTLLPVLAQIDVQTHSSALLLRNWVEAWCDRVPSASFQPAHVQLAPLKLLHHLHTLFLAGTLLG